MMCSDFYKTIKFAIDNEKIYKKKSLKCVFTTFIFCAGGDCCHLKYIILPKTKRTKPEMHKRPIFIITSALSLSNVFISLRFFEIRLR